MKKALTLLLAACLALCGCASILDREYSTVEPHSNKFWESESTGTLRAESYQDIVNDLMLILGQHTEQAIIRLYNYDDGLTVSDMLEKAAAEVQQETALGSYAVEYITSSSAAQRGYYELSVQIGYRRTVEQIQNIVNATSVAAVPSLLESALDDGKDELTVRVGYWSESDHAVVEEALAALRDARGLRDEDGGADIETEDGGGETGPRWTVSYYPAEGPVGLIEFDFDAPEETLPAEETISAEGAADAPDSGLLPAELPSAGEDHRQEGADLPPQTPGKAPETGG